MVKTRRHAVRKHPKRKFSSKRKSSHKRRTRRHRKYALFGGIPQASELVPGTKILYNMSLSGSNFVPGEITQVNGDGTFNIKVSPPGRSPFDEPNIANDGHIRLVKSGFDFKGAMNSMGLVGSTGDVKRWINKGTPTYKSASDLFEEQDEEDAGQ